MRNASFRAPPRRRACRASSVPGRYACPAACARNGNKAGLRSTACTILVRNRKSCPGTVQSAGPIQSEPVRRKKRGRPTLGVPVETLIDLVFI